MLKQLQGFTLNMTELLQFTRVLLSNVRDQKRHQCELISDTGVQIFQTDYRGSGESDWCLRAFREATEEDLLESHHLEELGELIVFIKANKSSFPVEEVELRSLQIFRSSNFDETTIEAANLSVPILLAEISPGMFNVIDGNHRLEKACRAGINRIPAYRIYANQHLAFLTTVKAYKAYIE